MVGARSLRSDQASPAFERIGLKYVKTGIHAKGGVPGSRSGKVYRRQRATGLPPFLAVFAQHMGKDAAAHVPATQETQEAGLCRCDQIIENALCHGLMKGALIPERPQIQFEAF
jgi:hypothetical protein